MLIEILNTYIQFIDLMNRMSASLYLPREHDAKFYSIKNRFMT